MMNLYIANLAEYNNGRLVGAWVNLPLEEEELQAKIDGILGSDEEVAIHDYECDFMQIGEYDNIFHLNEIASIMAEMNEVEEKALKAFLDNGYDFNDAVQKVNDNDFMFFNDCQNMSHVAMELENEIGGFSPDTYNRYIDIEALARDLELEYYDEDEENYPEDFTEYAYDYDSLNTYVIIERGVDYNDNGIPLKVYSTIELKHDIKDVQECLIKDVTYLLTNRKMYDARRAIKGIEILDQVLELLK